MFEANLMIVSTSSAYVCIMEWSWGAESRFLLQKIDLEDAVQLLVGAWSAGPALPVADVGLSDQLFHPTDFLLCLTSCLL